MSLKQSNVDDYNNYDYLIKTVLVGDSGVGKSCLLKRFSENVFHSSFVTTIGVDFEIANMNIDGKIVKLQLWDTAGQERFRNITASYYRGAHAIMIVFDVTDPQSFYNVRSWIKEIEQYGTDGVQLMLVANKVDQEMYRKVTTEQVQDFAKQLDIPFLETSAKSAQNVDKSFMTIAQEYIKHKANEMHERSDRLQKMFRIEDAQPIDEKELKCCVIM